MEYQQYKTTALKHLQTCEYMIANLSLERLNKLKVLRNAYYLCGYTFEGLINFWIFKLLHNEGLIHNTDISLIRYPIELPNRKNLKWEKGNIAYDYWISQHKFQRNIEIFECINVGDLFANVPIIGDENLVSQRTLDIFRSWNVEIRYKNHPFPHLYPERGNELVFENDVKKFVITAREVWDELETITI